MSLATIDSLAPALRPIMSRPLVPASFPLGLAWYVAFVSAFAMVRSKDRDGREYFPVERRINELSFETYVPVEIREIMRRRKRVSIIKPALGSYIFVRFDPERDDWGAIRHLEDIHGILGADSVPQRVPDQVIEIIRQSEKVGAFGGKGLEVGDKVEIRGGPFSGLIARVCAASPKKRIRILLDGIKVTINKEFLAKVE